MVYKVSFMPMPAFSSCKQECCILKVKAQFCSYSAYEKCCCIMYTSETF